MALKNDKTVRNASMRSIKSLTSSKPTLNLPDSHVNRGESASRGLGRLFLDKLNENKDKIQQVDAVLCQTETNGSVRERGLQVAFELQARGIKENDIILICSRAHRDQTVAMLGAILVGAIVAPLDPEALLSEFRGFVKAARPRLAFCDARVCVQLELVLKDCKDGASCTIVSFGKGSDKIPFEKFSMQKASVATDCKTDIRDTRRKIAFVVPTQGTENQTKFTCVSHHAVYVQIMYLETLLRGVETFVSFFPLSWIMQVMFTCFCFVHPVKRILPGAFSERSACKLIHDLRIDTALLGTDLALRICQHPSFQDFDLSCLRLVYVGGVSTTALEVAHLRSQFHGAVLQGYGLTEMAGFVSGFSVDEYETALKKPASVGKPLPGIKIKIVNSSTREVLKNGWWGELLVSGPAMMLGYFKNPTQTLASMEKNYLKTGDVAQFDDEGYLYVEGRTTDYIQLDGRSFIPSSIEEMIITHPYVVEAVVIGGNNELVACVIKKQDCNLTVEMLMEYLEERLPEAKRPTRIKFMESFPKTSVGKIKRTVIRETMMDVVIEHSKSIVSLDVDETGRP